ncbi:class I SAM-dependent methyltransferase [Polyangium jinanense]|uniref:Methyltransferase domain-containing protein n=1 Tax=Polyangium jinanense TaxID=2829994 RepID=A0A9X3WYJ6_9BACT|nr:class I SAM-dependent methyltransferase [Polyangium jinanense]MDC3953771.1 methyltransferase domain-containing protein [Polyangium jinanense]MDC3979108.1 methyltransferase domain-containing protein [Polyangium jinanense]
MSSPPSKRSERTRTRARRDLELEAGTSAHYEDPAYYTKTYRSRLDDVRFYADYAAERGGPVLEYGCGNGRITLPIARLGLDVTGVDLSADMLADLRARLRDEPADVRARVTTKRGDMRAVRLGRRFPLVICPFNAFLHLYTRVDVERFLARVRAHLAPRGELVFDVSIPEPEELARDPGRAYATPRFNYPTPDGKGMPVRYTERFDYDKIRQILFVAMEFSPVSGEDSWMTPLAHRQFYPRELEALLHYNGFEILDAWGDFDRSPPTRDSITLILRARARRR